MPQAAKSRIHCAYCRPTHAVEECGHCPSPDAIRSACLRIQSTWSSDERARRQAMTPDSHPEMIQTIAAYRSRCLPRE